ncbi:alpha/beta hydrolase family protein [soil metagenome]
MAFLECRFFSEALGLSCSMNVILPQQTTSQIGLTGRVRSRKHPVLWLLHGMSDDHTIWARRTSIERYASEKGLCVIMPAANLSWYQNMASGPAYGTFLREELPAIAQSFFPLSSLRKDNFVAGLSMGGYGAFLLALSQPERFAAAASLSGALNVAGSLPRRADHFRKVLRAAFGSPSKIRNSPADLLYLATKLARSKTPQPALYACCGTEDFLLPDNRAFVAHLKSTRLKLAYEEHPGASHTWDYWDHQIQQVIDWLPLGSR